MTEVVNLQHADYDIYIGRGSIWGNPFRIGDAGATREDVIARYREYMVERLRREPELRLHLEALRGKRLGCFCKPRDCHGNVLVELLGGGDDD